MNTAAPMETLEQFVDDAVPARCVLASALMEYTALSRGLGVQRFNRQIALVSTPGTAVPFHGINGPDSSETGHLVRAYRDVQYELLAARGVPVPRWSVFAAAQGKRALKYATRLESPVIVRPARVAGGVTTDVTGAAAFRTAWQTSVDAGPIVMVREQIPGRTVHAFVVGGRMVSATELVGMPAEPDRVFRRDSPGRPIRGEIVDVTDEVDAGLAEAAVKAAEAMPGVPYATVELVLPADEERWPAAVVLRVDCTAVPVAHFPTAGQARDVAGAIVDHYAGPTRWQTALRTPHRDPASQAGPAVEPLYRGQV